jgi:chromosomal replication initiation ATPase DnaA
MQNEIRKIKTDFLELLKEQFHLVPKKKKAVIANSEFIEQVFQFVCKYRGQDPLRVREKLRISAYVQTRYLTYHVIKSFCPQAPLQLIGHMIGKKDHATVLHGLRTVSNQYEVDKNYRKYVEELKARFLYENEIPSQTTEDLINTLIRS